MLHPLTVARLENALARPGCPVCWEMERASRNYLRRLLREDKGHEAVWERLQKNRGLCLPHTRGLLAEEARTIPGFSTATLYRWLAEELLRQARWDGSGRHRLSRREFRSLLEPRGGCLACQQLGEYERAVVGDLVQALTSGAPPALRETYPRGDGLCLPHLRITLDLANQPAAVDLLRERFLSRLQTLATELEAFLEAHTPNGTRLEKVSSNVWRRAAEWFAGRLGHEGNR